MKQYLEFMRHVKEEGRYKEDRTGTGTLSVFGYQMRFNLAKGFPLVTTKQLHLKSIVHELIWFLAGSTNIQYLRDNGVKIWDEWADENGDLGPVYGSQWRNWPTFEENVNTLHESYLPGKGIDQISEALQTLRSNPDSRRIMVSAWNVADVSKMKLPPCHALFQFYTEELTLNERWKLNTGDDVYTGVMPDDVRKTVLDNHDVPTRRLSCQLYQRSADIFLGVPFNIASYALLTHMFAQQLNMAVGDFIWTGGDCHLYSNHLEQVDLQLSRDTQPLPRLLIKRKPDSLFDYKFDDFEFQGYIHHPSIKAPVAV